MVLMLTCSHSAAAMVLPSLALTELPYAFPRSHSCVSWRGPDPHQRPLGSWAPSWTVFHTALVAHEEAITEVRTATGSSNVSVAALSLKYIGRHDLAKRLRSSARSRSAVAHPDGALVEDIRDAYESAQERIVADAPVWPPEGLRDDRRLGSATQVCSLTRPVMPARSRGISRPRRSCP